MTSPSKKPTGGPAFPNASIRTKEGIDVWGDGGMTLRDYFAAKAMQGALASHVDDPGTVALYAYKVADSMLEVRDAKT